MKEKLLLALGLSVILSLPLIGNVWGTSDSLNEPNEEMILTILIPGASSEQAECMLVDGRIFCKKKEDIEEWRKKYLEKTKEE